MAERPIVILHGWSDTEKSFRPLAGLLRSRLNRRDVSIVSLANYISMEADIRFDDLVAGMHRAWVDHDLPSAPGSVDAIVHSTGALVIRDWLRRNFEVDRAPVRHLVMLAPANFGSPLAHKGRSFNGRFFKGFVRRQAGQDAFETGAQILKGLELASPYTWNLAEHDRFGDGGRMYQPGNVLCTVLVGNAGYSGIRSMVNEDGSDGTVRTSTANMNCARITAEFPADPGIDGHDVEYAYERSSGMTAFGVMDGYNHSGVKLTHRTSIAQLNRTKRDSALFDRILAALSVTDDAFPEWCQELSTNNEELLSRASGGRNPAKHGFQNTVVHVVDQFGVGVDDYLLEFYEKDDERDAIAEEIHSSVIRKVHRYCDDTSYRSVYIDCTRLAKTIDKVGECLSVSLTASPQLGERSPVGFRTLEFDEIGGIRVRHEDIDRLFSPHRTVLVTLKLMRQHVPDVFRFEEYLSA